MARKAKVVKIDDKQILVAACYSFSNSPKRAVKSKPIKRVRVADYF